MSAYTKVHEDWKNYPDTSTPLTDAGLEQMESGIATAHSELQDHLDDTTAAHAATAIASTPSGNLSSTNVQAGLQEIQGDVDTINAALAATATRTAPVSIAFTSAITSGAWPDGATHEVRMGTPVPGDYLSGDITLKLYRRAGASSGTAVMRKSSFRFRDATAFSQIDSSVNINFTPGDQNTHILSAVIAAANFQAGDTLRWDISRLGADGSDTLAGLVDFDGAFIEYTALAK